MPIYQIFFLDPFDFKLSADVFIMQWYHKREINLRWFDLFEPDLMRHLLNQDSFGYNSYRFCRYDTHRIPTQTYWISPCQPYRFSRSCDDDRILVVISFIPDIWRMSMKQVSYRYLLYILSRYYYELERLWGWVDVWPYLFHAKRVNEFGWNSPHSL